MKGLWRWPGAEHAFAFVMAVNPIMHLGAGPGS